MTTLDTRRNGAPIAAQTGGEPALVDSLAPGGEPGRQVEANSPRRGWPRITRRPADPANDELRTLHLVRRSRCAAVWLTVGIAIVSFVLSFTSLRDLAATSAWPGWPSWLWPLIIDGLIVLATLAIVSLAPYRDQFWNRVFVWLVLGTAALVSVGGNSFHAWLATGQLPGWMRIGSAGLACVTGTRRYQSDPNSLLGPQKLQICCSARAGQTSGHRLCFRVVGRCLGVDALSFSRASAVPSSHRHLLGAKPFGNGADLFGADLVDANEAAWAVRGGVREHKLTAAVCGVTDLLIAFNQDEDSRLLLPIPQA